MRTYPTARQLYVRSLRGTTRSHRPGHRVAPLVVGQWFDIDVSRKDSKWVIRIPEIGASTHTNRRAAVELKARECIAAYTGIPIGYIAVCVRD